jgi:hypothetical protein
MADAPPDQIDQIILKRELHPAAHAAKKSCLDGKGNAYGGGREEPWGATSNGQLVRGVRFGFSITPVFHHNYTLPYTKLYEVNENPLAEGAVLKPYEISSYRDIYRQQPRAIRWFFELFGIHFVTGKQIVHEKLQDAMQQAEDTLRGAVRDAIKFLVDASEEETVFVEETDRDIISKAEDEIDEIQQELDDRDPIIKYIKELTERDDANKNDSILAYFEAKLRDDIASMGRQSLALLESARALAEKLGIPFDQIQAAIDKLKADLDAMPESQDIIELAANKDLEGSFVSYINRYESRNAKPDGVIFGKKDTDPIAFNWGIRDQVEHVFFGNDPFLIEEGEDEGKALYKDSGTDDECPYLLIYTGTIEKRPDGPLGNGKEPSAPEMPNVGSDPASYTTPDGQTVPGTETKKGGWTYRAFDGYVTVSNGTGERLVHYRYEFVSPSGILYVQTDTIGDQGTRSSVRREFNNSKETEGWASDKPAAEQNKINEERAAKRAATEKTDKTKECLFVVQMIKRFHPFEDNRPPAVSIIDDSSTTSSSSLSAGLHKIADGTASVNYALECYQLVSVIPDWVEKDKCFCDVPFPLTFASVPNNPFLGIDIVEALRSFPHIKRSCRIVIPKKEKPISNSSIRS